MVKRGTKMIVFLGLLILLIIPLVSAGIFSDFWGKITGKATQDTTALNITIGNAAPTIEFVEVIASKNPTDDTTTTITFNFTATDDDGAGTINVSTAQGYFTRSGEPSRFNTSCLNWSSSEFDVNFTCTIDMWYFDENGAWDINVSIRDINDAYDDNTSTSFTYNALPGMKMSPIALGWTGVGLSTTDKGSDDIITINNTGNRVNININVTSLDLQGEGDPSEYIFAENFTVENASEGCTGTAMVNDTSINVTSAILQRGNHSLNYNNATSGQEQIYVCLKGVPQDISPQSYSSAILGAWTIKIVTT